MTTVFHLLLKPLFLFLLMETSSSAQDEFHGIKLPPPQNNKIYKNNKATGGQQREAPLTSC